MLFIFISRLIFLSTPYRDTTPEVIPTFTGETIEVNPTYQDDNDNTASHFSTTISTGVQTALGANQNVANAVNQSAGIQLQSTGQSNDFSTLSIRGGTSAQTGVFLDGVNLNPASISTVDMSTLSLFGIESIEVYHGFTPLELGPEGFTGSIQLKSLIRPFRAGFASISGGSFWHRQIAAGYQDVIQTRHLRTSWLILSHINYSAKEGRFQFLSDNGTPLNSKDDQWRERVNNDQAVLTIDLKLQKTFASLMTLKNSFQMFIKEQGIAPTSQRLISHTRYRLIKPILTTAIEDIQLNNRMRLSSYFLLFGQWAHTHNPQPDFINHAKTTSIDELTIKTNNQLNINLFSWLNMVQSFNFSYQYYQQIADIQHSFYRLHRFLLGGASILRGHFLRHALNIEIGTRFDLFIDHGSLSANRGEIFSFEQSTHFHFFPQPQFGISYNIFKQLNLSTHAGGRQRVPTFYEYFGLPEQLRGNAQLKSEKQWSFDLGGKYHYRHFIQTSAVYAQTHTFDLITYVQVAQDLPKAINLSKSIIHSLELSTSATPCRWVEAQIYYTFLHSSHLTQGAENGKSLPWRPAHHLISNLFLFFPSPVNARFMYQIQYMSTMFIDSNGTSSTPDRFYHNASMTFQPARGPFFFTFEMRNIFNQQTGSIIVPILGQNKSIQTSIVDFLGYPLPGRSFYFHMTYAFGDSKQRLGEWLCKKC